MNFCTECGYALKPGARFCGKCGETVNTKKPQNQQTPDIAEICKSCGTTLPTGIKFCTACGSPVQSATANIPQPAVSIPVSSVKPVSQLQKADPTAKKGRKKVWIISGLLIVMLAAAFYVVRFYPEDSNNETEEGGVARSEFMAQLVVNGTTTEESKEVSVAAGDDASIVLSDSCSILITDMKSDGKVVLKKESNTINPGLPGIETSGYMVSLTVQMADNQTAPRPVITIPRSQAGDINPATINILRISDLLDADGALKKNQIQLLPVSTDENGNFTAVDYLFPLSTYGPVSETASAHSISSGLEQLFFPKAFAQTGRYLEGMATVANVKYCIVTFQGHLNWSKNPRLVQMTPDRQKAYFRHPATGEERQERKQPVTNIIVLVHGHNEEEKGGYVQNAENGIWEFGYKRDVWNYLYEQYLEKLEKAKKADVNKPGDCTLFYEFIYPSYRPVYTPVPTNSIIRHQTLGEDLGEAINKELLENNPQVAQMIRENIPFNLFIVGHSMGGLVARAGLRSLDVKLLSNFRQLITWGSPHQGSPVTTLRYITAAGFDISIDGLPFYPYDEYPSGIMKMLAMDTPGTRDLRWTNGSKGFEKFFNYDKYFRGNSFTERLNPEKWDLRTGTVFYNENLKTFNESEKYASKYTFLTGNTSKIAQVKKCNFMLTKAYYLLVKASDCAKGSYIIKLLAGDETYRDNDGASPVYGQGGQGLWPRPRSISMGDVDHEEFYGDKGTETAARTFDIMNETASCNCPYIDQFVYKSDTVSAQIVWPGLQNPAGNISKIDVKITDGNTKKEIASSGSFKFTDSTGCFKVGISAGKENAGKSLIIFIQASTSTGGVIDYTYNYVPEKETVSEHKETDLTGLDKMSVVGINLNEVRNSFSYKEIGNPNPELSHNEESTNGELIYTSFISNPIIEGCPPGKWNGYTFSWEYPGNPARHYDKESIQLTVKPGSPATVSGTITKSEVGCQNCTKTEELIFKDIPFKKRYTENNTSNIVFEIITNGPAQKYIPEYSIISTSDFGNGHKSVETIRMLNTSKVNISVVFVGEN